MGWNFRGRWAVVACMALGLLAAPGLAPAQVKSSASYLIKFDALGSAGGISFSTSYSVVGAFGQPTQTPLHSSTTYRLRGDYVAGYNATIPPGDVASFSASPGDSQVVLSWTNPTDTDFAAVRIRKSASGFPATPTDGAQVYDSNGTSYTDTSVTNGTTYYYTAFARDAIPNFAPGENASATPAPGPDITPPDTATDFVATAGDGEVVLTWSNPPDGDFSQVVLRYSTAGYPATVADGTGIYNGSGTTFTHSGLTNDIEYYYTVFAQDAVPNTSLGAQATATPAATPSGGEEGGGGSGGGGGGGCFIATAAYGSSLEPHVAALRAFRDRHLMTYAPGRILVAQYYRWSPPVANVIADSPMLRALTRGVLAPVVAAVVYPWQFLAAAAVAILLLSWMLRPKENPAD